MVFCPYIQEHESKLITNNVTNNNVVSKVIQKFKSYVQLQIHLSPINTFSCAQFFHTQAFMVASLPTTFSHIFFLASFVLAWFPLSHMHTSFLADPHTH